MGTEKISVDAQKEEKRQKHIQRRKKIMITKLFVWDLCKKFLEVRAVGSSAKESSSMNR